ncbi:uridine phosphorylase 1 [Agrilus planipennis]|uniref:Uridine phosphorylase 1 n=2 Tax=Agrilus planipennis TaxID=224129 RepID=A0A7F5QZJ6_AGRPL|nr:uridine phosphorylase 1 [Agrilus planipennis]
MLGKIVKRPAKLDKKLVRDLRAMTDPEDPYLTVTGKTMCTSDFYEEQARLDGAFCEYGEQEKLDYMNQLRSNGVINIEMESIPFAALTHHAGIKAAIVCVALLDRLKGDQVMAPKEVLNEWQMRPQKLVARYIKRYLQMKGRLSFEGHGSMAVKSPRRFKLVQQESETFD